MQDKNKYYLSRFQPFIGMNTKEIIEHLKIEINHDAKNLCSKLSMYILGKSAFDDLKNDGYVIKSVRLNSSLTPKEAISFPAFQYEKIVKEVWQKSDLFFHLSKRYLFVFYSQTDFSIKLNCIREWAIRENDIKIAEKEWLNIKKIIFNGNLVKELKRGKRVTNFPKPSENGVLHVRPHALNSNDVFILPTVDKLTGLNYYTKHSFWLNKEFIKQKILING